MTLPRLVAVLSLLVLTAHLAAQEKTRSDKSNTPPTGYKALFNGKDLTGWKGLPLKENKNQKNKNARPFIAMTMPERLSASPDELAAAQKRGDESAHEHWKVE